MWYLWPQTGQGYHFAGLSVLQSPLRNHALSLAADWSGALLLTTYSWYSSQDSKQSRHGLNLTPMCSSMTYYGNLTPCGSTLWVRVKRHAIHHCGSSMHRRLVENILLIVINLCTVSQYSISLRTYHHMTSQGEVCH